MPKGPVWTEREESILIKEINQGKKPDEISKRFQELYNFHDDVHLRSGDAIGRHLRSMKNRKNGNSKAANSGLKWDPVDDQRLLELFRDTSLEPDEIGVRLDRTEGAVKARIKVLGIGHLREPPKGFLPGLVARVTSIFRRPGSGK
ncbi:hypothetical protein [Methanobacterium sp.]|uniref:hypothetical protein n=1 Tax=Methanobacterium sp. TaxID=2164 RepID=UPI002AB8B3DC|nr:hypothetical protein [Methanobacterium sp.]MDY9922755.1 hypothetical protein [Methanobacterium sp.]